MVTATRHPSSLDDVRAIALHRPLTAEDLAILPDDGNRYEIIGGQLIVSPSPKPAHQRASFKLSGALYMFLEQTGLGEGFSAPADVHLSPNDVVQPDILVVLRANADIVTPQGIFGAPHLVVEILSPSSLNNDFLRKSKLYERFGVREYWIVDPENQVVSVQTLQGDRFGDAVDYGRSDLLTSTVLDGFSLELAAIFPEQTEETAQPTQEETQPANDQ